MKNNSGKTIVKWTRLTPLEIKAATEAASKLGKSLSAFIAEAVRKYIHDLR